MRKRYTGAAAAEMPPEQQTPPPPQAPPRRNPESSGGGIGGAFKWIFVISASAIVGGVAWEKYKDWRGRGKSDDDDDDDDALERNPRALPPAAPMASPGTVIPFPFPFSVPTPYPTPAYHEPPSRNRRRRDDDDEETVGDLLSEIKDLKKKNTKLERENRKAMKQLESIFGEDDD